MTPPRIYLSAPDASDDERELLLDAFDSNWIAPLGPHVDGFEREIAARAGMRHAAGLSSGTAAMDLALRLVGVQRGDRVVVPSFTFVGTVGPVVHMGAVPVFVDSEAASWNLDPDLLEEELRRSASAGELPAAVISVDIYGQCADYSRLGPICREYGIPLIEDAAEALGATWGGEPAGSFGACAIFSFNGNKIITTSGGGMLVSDDAAMVERARFLATQARSPAPHYEHDEIGFNYRMSNICAALGRGQLHGLDRKVERRREIFRTYSDAFAAMPGIDFMPESDGSRATRWLTVMTIDPSRAGTDRDAVREHLATHDIEARPAWKPMHQQPAFAGTRMVGGAVCESLFSAGLCLPSGSGMSDEQLARVVDDIGAVLSAAR